MGASYSRPQEIASRHFGEFEADLPTLTGKVVVLTGTTTGTGFVAARTCAKKGAHVVLLNRPSPRATAAQAAIAADAAPDARVESIDCDLASFTSVRSAAAVLSTKFAAGGIDVLVNNAGVMALADEATGDGYDVQMQTNHLSHFLITRELYPALATAARLRGEARVVNHSSGARAFPSSPLDAKYLGRNGGQLGGDGASMLAGGARWVRYHQTKLANAVFTLALADRCGGDGVKALCAAPGLAATNLQVTTAAAGGMGATWIMRFAQSAEDGTMPLLTAIAAPGATNGAFWEPAGSAAMAGLPIKKDLAAEALSGSKPARALLWAESEKAVGPWPLGAAATAAN